MIDNFHSEIERRLKREASQFSCDELERPTASGLLARHRSRRVAQSAVQTCGIVAASVIVLIAAVTVMPGAINDNTLAITSNQVDSIATEKVHNTNEQQEHLASADKSIETPDADSLRPAVPVFVVRTNENGDRSVLPAWYVPPTKRSIDYESLSAPQQRAVRKLLGKQYSPKRNAI